jgi:hypothetical protein
MRVCAVDASRYSDADWESMRSTAAESVLGRSLRRKSSRVAKPGSQEWGYEEVMYHCNYLRYHHGV